MRGLNIDAGQSEEPTGGRQERGPRQRAQPAVRRLPVDRLADGCEPELVQRAQLLRRPRPPRRGDAGRRALLLQNVLRAQQRRSRRHRRFRRRRSAKAWIEKYFAAIPRSTMPPPPDFTEPRQEKEKRAGRTDPLANRPALGLAYHVPRALHARVVCLRPHRSAARAGPGLAALRRARAANGRSPAASMPASTGASATCSTTTARCSGSRRSSTTRTTSSEQLLAAFDSVVALIQQQGVDQATLDRALIKTRSALYADIEQFAGSWEAVGPRAASGRRTACVDFHVTRLLEPESSSDQGCRH